MFLVSGGLGALGLVPVAPVALLVVVLQLLEGDHLVFRLLLGFWPALLGLGFGLALGLLVGGRTARAALLVLPAAAPLQPRLLPLGRGGSLPIFVVPVYFGDRREVGDPLGVEQGVHVGVGGGFLLLLEVVRFLSGFVVRFFGPVVLGLLAAEEARVAAAGLAGGHVERDHVVPLGDPLEGFDVEHVRRYRWGDGSHWGGARQVGSCGLGNRGRVAQEARVAPCGCQRPADGRDAARGARLVYRLRTNRGLMHLLPMHGKHIPSEHSFMRIK